MPTPICITTKIVIEPPPAQSTNIHCFDQQYRFYRACSKMTAFGIVCFPLLMKKFFDKVFKEGDIGLLALQVQVYLTTLFSAGLSLADITGSRYVVRDQPLCISPLKTQGLLTGTIRLSGLKKPAASTSLQETNNAASFSCGNKNI